LFLVLDEKEVSQMSKKLLVSYLAVVAVATVPSVATAKPVVTHPTGTVLAAGLSTHFKGTNVGEIEFGTSWGPYKCSTATLTGTLTTNGTAGGFEGDIETMSVAGTGATIAGEPDRECTSPLGNFAVTPGSLTSTNGFPWCLEGTEASDQVKIRGNSCTKPQRGIRFALPMTGFSAPVTCQYERSSSVAASLTTHPSEAVISIVKQVWPAALGNPAVCFSSIETTMSFRLETDSAIASPFYISS
jgi:hypothetical protein